MAREPRKKTPRIGADALAFGTRLKNLREAANLTIADVASGSHLSAQSISSYERDLSIEPSFHNGMAIAAALGVTPSQLAGAIEPTVPTLTPPNADPDRFRELEEEVLRLGIIGDRVAAIDAALDILVKAEWLPKTLRARVRVALGPELGDRS